VRSRRLRAWGDGARRCRPNYERKPDKCYCKPHGVPGYAVPGKCWGRYVGAWNSVAVGCVVVIGVYDRKVGTDYAAISQKVGPPKPGQSRVVVLQQKRDGLSMAICACDAKVDGSPMGKVMVGTYAYADLPAGPHQLVASETLFRATPSAISPRRLAAPISFSSSRAHDMIR